MSGRNFALESAQDRQFSIGDHSSMSPLGSAVYIGDRARDGTREIVTLSWPTTDIVTTRYLLEHYREHRRSEAFLFDFADGAGPLECRYAAPPTLSTAAPSGAGPYSIPVEVYR